MELTEEQLKRIIETAITENNKTLLNKQDAITIFAKKVDVPNAVDTSQFITKADHKESLVNLQTILKETTDGIITDVKKLINKVFPEQTQAQKSKWFVFD